MISHISGKIIYKDDKYLVIESSKVGYKVFVPTDILRKINLDSEVSFWTHMSIRENAQDLYGFNTKNELDFFELLISIPGIGPKTALNILNISSIEALKKAVSSGDTSHIVKISGIGKKIADKIVLELKGKILGEEAGHNIKEEVDAFEALKSLGYSQKEASDALKAVQGKTLTTNERIKEALKILGR